MAKKKTLITLSGQDRALYIVQDIFGEIMQISPWVLTKDFNLRSRGADDVDFAEFARRAGQEFSITYPESILDAKTIGDAFDETISLLPSDFDYDALKVPEVPEDLW